MTALFCTLVRQREGSIVLKAWGGGEVLVAV